jgi:inorganic pyrophosphatase
MKDNKLVLNVTVEIAKNSNIKYEYDRKTGKLVVDRILYGSMHYPMNYGFIPEALDWDGDELDVLIMSNEAFIPGCSVPTKIIGALELIDNGETDTKLIGVINVDPRCSEINDLKDVPAHLLKEIHDFFSNYKNLQKKKVEVKDFRDKQWAIHEYEECLELMNKYGKMDKDKFIEKMMMERPEKYS